ncbi:MAG: LytTR family DNA-binding domain-containing protein [Pyrinomonadaceae bacterium]
MQNTRDTANIDVLLIDDEPLARELIADMLSEFSGITVIGECADGKEAVATIPRLKPDLVFLDVQMPLMNGFEVLEQIRDSCPPEIIFVTAYEQYAVKAFDFHAVDYLLKPLSRDRFREAVARAMERLIKKETRGNEEIFASLIDTYRKRSSGLQRIFVKDQGRIILVEPENIDWIEADDKYVRIYTEKKRYLIRQTIGALEKELDSTIFMRIHRSKIVNLKRVKEVNPLFGGEHELVLRDGTKIAMSRNYKKRFFDFFNFSK